MTDLPLVRYQADLTRSGFVKDDAQHAAVEKLDALCREVIREYSAELSKGSIQKLVGKLFRGQKTTPVRGLYLWGGVGRGKTYVMDIFFDALPFEQKMRTHFHRFMRRVHGELKKLKDQQDPLKLVANTIADEVRIICFDEFFVSDITDAMILANLLEALFERGVTLVATSNIEPSGLYKDGLQRARFLPAIALLEKHTEVFKLDGGVDYRLRTLEKASLYHCPLSDDSYKEMDKCFVSLIPDVDSVQENIDLDVEGRPIRALKEADDVVWFDFSAVCDGPRSQNDYIELAREYHAVLVSNVPEMGAANDDQAKRFIYLVDEFYDRRVKLILSAEKPILELYGEGRLSFEFQRTVSRLQEMQSHEYLSSAHKA